MSLPPELINRVLKHLSDDPESLRALSLVSKVWASWCQALLFKSIHLTPPMLRRWFENVSKEADGPASHTRALTLEEYRLIPWINPHFLDFPLPNLASFSDVRSLSLIQWNATLFNGEPPGPYFGHFGKSLRKLSLRFCTLNPVVLFDFLSLLPKVEDLEIAHPYPPPLPLDTIPDVPELTPSFCGTLSLADYTSEHLILKALATFPLHFSTIRIKGCAFYEPEPYQMLLTSCRNTLVSLRFEEVYRGAFSLRPGSTRIFTRPHRSRSAHPIRLAGVLQPTPGGPHTSSQLHEASPVSRHPPFINNVPETSKDIVDLHGFRR